MMKVKHLFLMVLASVSVGALNVNAESSCSLTEHEKAVLEVAYNKLIDTQTSLVLTAEERDILLDIIKQGMPEGSERDALVRSINNAVQKDAV